MKAPALLFALFLGLSTFATQPQSAPVLAQSRLEQVTDRTLEFEFRNPLEQTLELRIYGNSGALLYKRNFKEAAYHVGFDLSRFPEGEYRVEVYLDGDLWKQETVLKHTPAVASGL